LHKKDNKTQKGYTQMNWTGKKILVTGACGFIGSHLVEKLVELNADVKVFVLYNSFNNWGWIDTLYEDIKQNIDIHCGDIVEAYSVRKVMKDIDIVFHLAALIAIPYSYISPASYVNTNIKGTLNILQAAKDYGVKKIIHTSTSEVYGTAQYVPIDEKHPLQPQSPYSATKISADAMAESYWRSFDLPVIIARPFNTYGPRQSARAVIPTIITQLLNYKKEIKLGSLHPTRSFNYVEDICKGFIALAECEEAIGKIVNIGSRNEISIGGLAKLIIELIYPEAKIVSEDIRKRPGKSEVERLVCDNSLIKKLTGWKPMVSLEEGLLKTIEWFRSEENFKKYKSNIYNI
jgi:NAD dependent epimerase/dehydratase